VTVLEGGRLADEAGRLGKRLAGGRLGAILAGQKVERPAARAVDRDLLARQSVAGARRRGGLVPRGVGQFHHRSKVTIHLPQRGGDRAVRLVEQGVQHHVSPRDAGEDWRRLPLVGRDVQASTRINSGGLAGGTKFLPASPALAITPLGLLGENRPQRRSSE